MEITKIRKKIGTDVVFLFHKNAWIMEFYLCIDDDHYPIEVELSENDNIKIRSLSLMDYPEVSMKKTKQKLSESDAFQKIKRKIETFEEEFSSYFKIEDAYFRGPFEDGYAFCVSMNFPIGILKGKSYILCDSFDETLKQPVLKEMQHTHVLLYAKKTMTKDKMMLVPFSDKCTFSRVDDVHSLTDHDIYMYSMYPLSENALYRGFLSDLYRKVGNHPKIRIRMLNA